MSELRAAHAELADILAGLGIEVGDDVLNVWSDRLAHGYEPLPDMVLTRLAGWVAAMRATPLPAPMGRDSRTGSES